MITEQPTEQLIRPPTCMPRELVANTAFLLGRLGWRLKSRVFKEFEQEGFEGYDYAVLAFLAENGSSTQASIADTIKLDRSQLVGVLDALEEHRLVERRRDTKDRRRQLVSLTHDGEQALKRMRALVKRLEREFLEPLDDDSRQTLHRLLLTLACHHEAERFPSPDVAS